MITAGAIVVASFFSVSAVVQLFGVLKKPNSKATNDDTISFWFRACACILFGGNGLVWVLDASDTYDCSEVDMENVTSTVAILSALAFLAALFRFFLSVTMLSVAASFILITAHAARANRICGSMSIVLGSSTLLFVIVRAFSLLFPRLVICDNSGQKQ